ncbi:hypothetical protein N8D74_13220 [Curtobacterium flaccumfaciens]|uniref:T3SS peptide-binding chaperone domain-containing protein n=1 Tax=Curtobacterium poinsettiae TaxID=159612 RepID=A0A9Q9P511_9MICO|nr:hypothetical protein [Curtobacterium flaccumfaciens]UXN24514.1 hypothetical protein N8D74_13220 [Curtobacterium flaccumfaciens]UYC79350.1 hypothetical protein OE229_09295 [Curtobacterium flaccumfaciens pv. poinsettiae]
MDDGEWVPADRFVDEQRWWVASELARRHAGFMIREVRANTYTSYLEVGPRAGEAFETQMEPTIRITLFDIHGNSFPAERALLGASSPHEVVKKIESTHGIANESTPGTNARTLAYRVLSKLMTLTRNDREPVRIASARDNWSQHWDEDEFDRGYLEQFVGAREAADRFPHLDRRHELDFFWVLLRKGEPDRVIDENAVLYHREDPPMELLPVYFRRHLMNDVLSVVLASS